MHIYPAETSDYLSLNLRDFNVAGVNLYDK